MSYLLPPPTLAASNPFVESVNKPVIGVSSFSLIQAKVAGSLTVPAVGASVAAAVDPMPNIVTADAFQVGDVAIVNSINSEGYSDGVAWFRVTSVSGNTLTLELLNKPRNAASGQMLSNVEVTGQTRLSSIPANATEALVTVTLTDTVVEMANNGSGEYSFLAQQMIAGQAIAHCGFKVGIDDIDYEQRNGFELATRGSYKIDNRADIEAFRLVARSPIALPVKAEVVYR